ncbi:hypothetical protein A2272_02310 [Candidatus Peregrinibacteria bacterium RIFOXYA12_FULL_33_12]|nr:MAG: hypothetical protein A2272_02310 [Candidatus Peregrinibacteria bacterium RIFOXYA12_FULL_33_12]OGJ46204.1 MAG: hypothetical protein A2263_04940 [Candidatus Peregrinibacteria bacterium RIFOXYA2_FULL_33_21]OGJ51620.1 MAG: hypothetical protein A2307_04110 [Candidatus Peregrinibacteria bacterium RIFOXYB2_FULL_33_20]
MKKLFTIFIIYLVNLQNVYAAVTIPDKYKPSNLPNSLKVGAYDSDTINAYLQFFAGKLIKIAGPLAIMMLVSAGIMMATSRGESGGQLDNAKKRLQYVVYGLLIILVSYVIVQTVITIAVSVNS